MLKDRNNEVIIVLPKEPDQTEKFAAEELVKYLAKISSNKIVVSSNKKPEKRFMLALYPLIWTNLLLTRF
jgi:hypothetical protein